MGAKKTEEQFSKNTIYTVFRNINKIFRKRCNFTEKPYSILVSTTVSIFFTVILGAITGDVFISNRSYTKAEWLLYYLLYIYLGMIIGYLSQMLLYIMKLFKEIKSNPNARVKISNSLFRYIPIFYMSAIVALSFLTSFDFEKFGSEVLTNERTKCIIYYTIAVATIIIAIITQNKLEKYVYKDIDDKV